jgi:4-amino-4-deoxy-L-arabinose transferase-like glycosyltransferase
MVCLSFAMRVYRLDASGFWFDEAASYFIASKGVLNIVEYVRQAPGEHPPTYYLLLSLWMPLAGTSEFAIRFVSVWFGVLFVVLFYRFARHHFDTRLTLVATTLSAAFPFLVDYSQEARMYTLVLCPTILAMDYFLRWARDERHAAHKYLFFFCLAVSIHYYAVWLMAAHDVYLLSRRALQRTLSKLMLFWHVALVVLLGVWFFYARGNLDFANRALKNPLFAGHNFSELTRIAVDLTVGSVVIRPLTGLEYWLAAGAWLVLLFGVWHAQTQLHSPTHAVSLRGWVIAVAIVPPLLAAAVPYVYAARYLFVILPSLLLLWASGLLALRARGRVALAAGCIALASVGVYGVNFTYQFTKSPYRELAAIISSHARLGDGVILTGTGQWPLQLYYLRQPWRMRYIPTNADAAELVDIDPAMRAMQQAHDRVWVLSEQAYAIDPADNVARWLSLNAYPVSRQWFGHDAVALFLTGRELTPTPHHALQFGEWLVLEHAALSSREVTAGEALALQFVWHALKPIPQKQQLLITLRLFDAQGRIVQERVTKPCDGFCAIDDWIPGEAMTDRHGLLVPADAPVGEYTLRLEVFAPRQNQSLPISGLNGEAGTSLVLGRITVRQLPPKNQHIFLPLIEQQANPNR